MKKYFCPICGNSLDEEFSIGNICPCCGNESEFHDDISVEYLKRSNKLPIPSGINISDYRDFEILPKMFMIN
ncbi:MAG: hypothetical protein FH761_07415 [Firmicutes bacterium]|nr:hypothetical protein [Bacillota bacterium]